jgi:hypothetical protein
MATPQCENLASSHSPETPAPNTEDWLTVAKADPTRNNFLEWMGRILPSAPNRANVPARIWAFAMVAPVEKLVVVELEGSQSLPRRAFLGLNEDIKLGLNAWQQRGAKESESDENDEAPSSKRRKTESATPSRPTTPGIASTPQSTEWTGLLKNRDGPIKTKVRHNITDFCLGN